MEEKIIEEKFKRETNNELEKLLADLKLLNKVKIGGLITSGLIFLTLRLLKITTTPWLVILLILGMIIPILIFDILIKKNRVKEVAKVDSSYFILQIIELLVVFNLIHISGGAFLFGAFILGVYSFTSYFIYTQKKYLISILTICVFGYLTLITLEYLGILFTGDAIYLGLKISKNLSLFLLGLIPNGSLLTILFLFGYIFSRRLKNLFRALSQKEKELQEAKTVLEIKVGARTRELEEGKASLEEKIKQRTKELQERVDELERLHRLAVGRELKMIELKEEIKKLKTKLKE